MKECVVCKGPFTRHGQAITCDDICSMKNKKAYQRSSAFKAKRSVREKKKRLQKKLIDRWCND